MSSCVPITLNNLIFIIIFSFRLFLLSNAFYFNCETPEGEEGVCIPIKNCKFLIHFFRTIPKPISEIDSKYIKSYYCDQKPITTDTVCCPLRLILPERIPKPPQVSNHKNIKLINNKHCGLTYSSNRILNKYETSLFEYPWMALLLYKTRDESDSEYNNKRWRWSIRLGCGGTLINNKYVLTAAHCITNLGSRSLIAVRLGEHNINTGEDCEDFDGRTICAPAVQDFGIERVIPHPDYNITYFTNDIGLIELRGEANLTAVNVKPICLPTTKKLRKFNFPKINGSVTGWGVTATGKESPELLQVSLSVIEPSLCRNVYDKMVDKKITYKQFCAGGFNEGNPCKGDSGGPFQIPAFFGNRIRFVQHGIVSYGTPRCGKKIPNVFTKVAYYIDWILNTITF